METFEMPSKWFECWNKKIDWLKWCASSISVSTLPKNISENVNKCITMIGKVNKTRSEILLSVVGQEPNLSPHPIAIRSQFDEMTLYVEATAHLRIYSIGTLLTAINSCLHGYFMSIMSTRPLSNQHVLPVLIIFYCMNILRQWLDSPNVTRCNWAFIVLLCVTNFSVREQQHFLDAI